MPDTPTIGVIGGSGLYDLPGLGDVASVRVPTPFGEPSDEIVTGRLGRAKLLFLPRHGHGHRILPHEVNSRANIWALKQLGAEWVIAVSAVGSMREDIRPGDLVLPHQYIDRTRARPSTFFGDGVAVHVSFADPVCTKLAGWLADAADAAGARVHRGGTYVCIDGPQFSTRAESKLYRSWGVDVIGMTALPEAKLAREAEMSYATLALATDYDVWHHSEEPVTAEAVVAVMRKNVAAARDVVARAVAMVHGRSPHADALEDAIMTAPAKIPPATRERLALLIGRYLGTP
ncbi:MAG TPA: S-methyl-5'-thioadenosine phosphorylase [Haliangiales bacterium]|nr:S-methyl-5'-thioadenosine phosphorylase [Haliangiales bacterium]